MKISTLVKCSTLAIISVNLLKPISTSVSTHSRHLGTFSFAHLSSLQRALKAVDKKPESEEEPESDSSDETEETVEEEEEPEEKKSPKPKKTSTEPVKSNKTEKTEKPEKPSKTKKESVKTEKTVKPKKPSKTDKPKPKPKKSTQTQPDSDPDKKVNDKRIKGFERTGILDGSAEGDSEIDKIDQANPEGWRSIFDSPPKRLIQASLYAFIQYNNTEVCTSFNMTFTAVEEKDHDGEFKAYHVVADVDCLKNNNEETPGKFVLNFVPEGDRLLLTECGHREEGEILNWIMIKNQVPECMTPKQRREFLSQPLKHVHAVGDKPENDKKTNVTPTVTNFFSQVAHLDAKEVAVFGSATFALISIIVIVLIFVARKRKAQLDLERTIAGAKAEKAVEDDPVTDTDTETGTVERKGLMDTSKAKDDNPEIDAEVEEGAFVNSPAVKV